VRCLGDHTLIDRTKNQQVQELERLRKGADERVSPWAKPITENDLLLDDRSMWRSPSCCPCRLAAERETRVFVLLGGRTANFTASPIVALTSRTVSDLCPSDFTFHRFHDIWLTMWPLHFER
jgi:hypothetical protein